MGNLIDIELIDKLSDFQSIPFEGKVFRVTRKNTDPTASSISGGRWALPSDTVNRGTPVLYTSLEPNGAKAEIASFLSQLNPLPTKILFIHSMQVTLRKAIKLTKDDLTALGVGIREYNQREYSLTQKIGSAISFLEFDGLIAPSARWNCDNLMIYTDNHSINEQLEVIDSNECDWQEWAIRNNIIS